MAKYIFLDFDGVLNTENYQKQLKESGSIATDRYGFLFDPAAVANLKTIIDNTGAKVCVTSSWAIEIGADNLPVFWKARQMPGTLAGTTAGIPVGMDVMFDMEDFDPYKLLEGGLGARGSEVKAFLERKGAAKSPYVILDDTTDFCKDQQSHFIQIDPRMGITTEDTERAIEILNNY